MTGLTERTVFAALAHLENRGFIIRGPQGPGPFANVITVLETMSTNTSQPVMRARSQAQRLYSLRTNPMTALLSASSMTS